MCTYTYLSIISVSEAQLVEAVGLNQLVTPLPMFVKFCECLWRSYLMMLYDVDESELFECGMSVYFRLDLMPLWSVLEVKKRQRVNYLGNVVPNLWRAQKVRQPPPLLVHEARVSRCQDTENKVKPLRTVPIVKDVRRFQQSMGWNDVARMDA